MDCEQVRELLDAFALGASDAEEAAAVESHVADCVRCWTLLNEAQRAAAAIALSATLERAPSSLRERVLAETAGRRQPVAGGQSSLLRRLLPTAAALAGAAAAAALAFAFVLQAQVNDLSSDKDALEEQVQRAEERLDEQRQAVAILAAEDMQNVSLETTEAADPTIDATAVLHWSEEAQTAVLICDGLPELDEGEVYKVWLVTDEENYELADFRAWRDGSYQTSMSMKSVAQPPVGIGISIEEESDGAEPSAMILWADLNR